MSKYERFNHAKTFLRYHLIFSTKYRRKVLNPIRDVLLVAMKVAQEKNGNFKIEIDEVDHDHIHLLVRIKPNESISSVVHDLTVYLSNVAETPRLPIQVLLVWTTPSVDSWIFCRDYRGCVRKDSS